MNKTKVVFLGSRPLGKYALEKLFNLENVEIVGVIVAELKNRWWDEDPIEFVNQKQLKQIELGDLNDIDFDLGISINYWKIIDKKIINKPKLGFVNIHHAFDLELRGRGMSTRKILEEKKNKTHGTCIHYTDDGLDTGPIIESISFDVDNNDTAWTLTAKSNSYAETLIDKWFPILIKSKVNTYNPLPNQPLMMNGEYDNLRLISLENDSADTIIKKVKAFDFNGIFEPAYYLVNDKKIHLSFVPNNKSTETILINSNEFYKTNW